MGFRAEHPQLMIIQRAVDGLSAHGKSVRRRLGSINKFDVNRI